MKPTFGSGPMKKQNDISKDDLGWMQCTQCSWGTEVEGWEILSGDYRDGQACQDCGLGPCRIDWTWVAEEK